MFEKLGRDASDRGIPVLADVMLGLPGATMNSLKLDLQYCIDQEISARVFGTIMFPNSPMNEPEYRTEHQIEVDSLGQVVATSSYTRQERDEMLGFLDFFRIGEHFGLLRQVSRYVATETDIREIEVFTALHEIALAEPTVFPLLNFAARPMRRRWSTVASASTGANSTGLQARSPGICDRPASGPANGSRSSCPTGPRSPSPSSAR